MAIDGAFLYCTLKEIRKLVGAHADKIYQPSKDEIIISFRSFGATRKLLISANAVSARIGFTEDNPENPQTPPMFCMLLRKHLNGRLSAVRQDGFERIANLDFECINEFGDVVTLTLTVEIMGRHSNIILINENGKVIDAIRRVNEDMSSVRRILPGITYIPPEKQDKLNLLTATDSEITDAVINQSEKELSKALLSVLEGVSPLFCRECAFYVTRGIEALNTELTEDMKTRMLFFLHRAADVLNGEEKYSVLYDNSGMPFDFCIVPVYQYGSMYERKDFDSPSVLLDKFFAEKSSKNRIKQKSADLLKVVLNALERVSRRVENQKRELSDCENKDEYKICGDLISANLYRIEKGATTFETENFYDNNNLIKIKLKPTLNPSQNAQRYYALYKKSVTAEKLLTEQIASGTLEIEYIESVFDALSRAETTGDLNEIRAELEKEGYVRHNPKNKQKQKPLAPLEFVSSDGYTILVGRNNLQNDKLSLKMASKTDLWLHTQNIHGAHVIIFTNGEEVPMSTIEEGAILAAYHSKARESSKVPVDYTYARFVKKPSGAKPGMVIFTNNKTLFVTPDKQTVERLTIKG